MNYERLDPLGRGYIGSRNGASRFGGVACMKLFGLLRISSDKLQFGLHIGEEL